MNLPLVAMNKALKYANELANQLTLEYQIQTVSRIYSMYDGRKGIRFALYDTDGNCFIEYESGIHKTYDDLLIAINNQFRRIIKEQTKS